MNLIKKLVDWFEDMLRTRAVKDVLENPEYYLAIEDNDSADDSSCCCYSGVQCYADDCAICKERIDFFKEV